MKNQRNKQKIKDKMAHSSLNVSSITLNVNGVSMPLKIRDLQNGLQNMTQLSSLCETHFKYNIIGSLKVKKWKKDTSSKH